MLVTVDIPSGVQPGAVVELYKKPDGTLAAEVRIPARKD